MKTNLDRSLSLALAAVLGCGTALAVEVKSPPTDPAAATPRTTTTPLESARSIAATLKTLAESIRQNPHDASLRADYFEKAVTVHGALADELNRQGELINAAEVERQRARWAIERHRANLTAKCDALARKLAGGRETVEKLLASNAEADRLRAKDLARRFAAQERRFAVLQALGRRLDQKLATLGQDAFARQRQTLAELREKISASLEQLQFGVEDQAIEIAIGDTERRVEETLKSVDAMGKLIDGLTHLDLTPGIPAEPSDNEPPTESVSVTEPTTTGAPRRKE